MKKLKFKYKHRAPSKRYNLTFADTSLTQVMSVQAVMKNTFLQL